jgi:hypothetical protein
MGRAIDVVKGREWEERLRRYADSQLTVGDFPAEALGTGAEQE